VDAAETPAACGFAKQAAIKVEVPREIIPTPALHLLRSRKRQTDEKPMPTPYSKRCWFTFPTRSQVEEPIIWQMSRLYPDVSFDIRQASVQNEIGIMAVLLSGVEKDVIGAIDFLRSKGVMVEPIEKSVVEG
jgi:hypothetical protein